MPFPPGWNWDTGGPQLKKCPQCGMANSVKASNATAISLTGAVTQLYYCLACCWQVKLRYDPMTPDRYILCNLIKPDRYGKIRPLKLPNGR